MIIVHISTVHPKLDPRVFGKQCKHIAKMGGHKVYYIVKNKEDEVIDGVNIIALPIIKNRILRMLFLWIPALNKALKIKADIYQFHDPELLLLGIILKKLGKKVVFDIHEDYELQASQKEYLPVWVRRLISISYKKVEFLFVKDLDLLFTATPTIRDKYKKIHHNVIDIKNYPDLEEFSSSRRSFISKFYEVCYVGGISRDRGIYEYISCLDNLDVILNLGGNFTFQNTRNEVMALPGWKKVKEYGFVNRQQIGVIFERSKIGLVVLNPALNHIDALPVKMFEYMSAGIPVICSNFPAYEEIVINSKCGFSVIPGDVKELENKIAILLNDDQLWNKFSQNAIAAVETKYNWQIEFERLIKSYEKIF